MAGVLDGRVDEDTVEVRVRFSRAAYDALRDLARRTGMPESDVLRTALALERVYQDTRERGGRVLTEEGGRFSEVRVA